MKCAPVFLIALKVTLIDLSVLSVLDDLNVMKCALSVPTVKNVMCAPSVMSVLSARPSLCVQNDQNAIICALLALTDPADPIVMKCAPVFLIALKVTLIDLSVLSVLVDLNVPNVMKCALSVLSVLIDLIVP